ncbi:MAG TPA: PLP-dependent aminotransferase family protein [Ideonella sp.]|uniref:MocR-like pyridoxine biosynthesis transcription factor PdxR n=1 Tax=Ideonella sp. TaxID=1929293 RepID=UPI002CA247CA|nr:PLP-dependent aminotransferase family protein [Ideonella sp.]HSI48787.1 PLP-dependent aminotransferase family protein [Ideonella sp.]
MQDSARRGQGRALYDELRARMADGTYGPGAALPSTRALAGERGLSRTTVSLVYEQLAADGFLDTRPGAASRVAASALPPAKAGHGGPLQAGPRPVDRLSAIGTRMAALDLHHLASEVPDEIDFLYGPLAGRDFPTGAWLKALRSVERQHGARLDYEDPRGNLALRKALQKHLSQTRGLSCSVDQLMIVSGSQQALDLCARLLLDPGDPVVVENPGYRMAHHVFEGCGARLQCVDVDAQGLCTDQLAGIAQARLIYVTPTHQFPLGGFLPIGRRRSLLDWAAERGAWVIEDDYDSEYRYAVRPEAPLQSLDLHGRVIHVGTFSKTLSPQLRLGYMVLPPQLVPAFATAKRLADRHANTGLQRALALLLEDGSHDRHVRRIRRLQQARQRVLLDTLAAQLGPRVVVEGAASGLHVVAWLPGLAPAQEPALVALALRQKVRVHPVSPLFHPAGPAAARQRRPAGLVMGYALLTLAQIEEGVKRLAAVVRRLEPEAGWGRIF